MIPVQIFDFLERNDVSYQVHLYPRACTAQELAEATQVPGWRVAKSVIVEGGDRIWIAVLPATEVVDEKLLASLLGVPSVRLLHEAELEDLFPGCKPGAEPPFGNLFGLPVVVDSMLAEADRIVFRAGSHEEAIEIRYEDFRRLERDAKTGTFGRIPASAPTSSADGIDLVAVPP
jgi:Ala-tRNA(Pro) deacylase